MKTHTQFILMTLSLLASVSLNANPISGDCTFKGKKLYGKVRIVNYGEDIKVRIVNYNSDIKIRYVDYSPSSCGKWQKVNYGEDIKVRFVDSGQDIKVEIVNNGEGLN